MLYKHRHLEKKLRENGRTARAEILGMRTEGSADSAKAMRSTDDDLTTSWTLCWMHLRVLPDNEPPFEVNVRTRLNTFKYKGDFVPVLYDPDDHDKVVVDYERDDEVAMSQIGGTDGQRDPELEALGAIEESERAAAPASESQSRLDRLQQLADLHDRGVLTDEELASEKAKILNES